MNRLGLWRPVDLHHSVQHCGVRGGGLKNPAPSITRQLNAAVNPLCCGSFAHSPEEANPPWRIPVS